MTLSEHLTTGRVAKTALNICMATSLFIMLLVVAYPFTLISLPEKHVSLGGVWKLSFEDSPSFASPEFNDNTWQNITLPGKVINESINSHGKYKGICWLRKTFQSNKVPKKAGIILGRIANADQTFVNGTKIGSTGGFPPNEFAMWNQTRSYAVPDNLITADTANVIAIRVSYNQIGEIIGSLAVTDRKDCIRYGMVSNFMQITMGYLSIGVGITFFLLFSLFYFKNQDVEEYIYFPLEI